MKQKAVIQARSAAQIQVVIFVMILATIQFLLTDQPEI
jgi:hypothetical protein